MRSVPLLKCDWHLKELGRLGSGFNASPVYILELRCQKRILGVGRGSRAHEGDSAPIQKTD